MPSLRALILPAVLVMSACAHAQGSEARTGGEVEVADFRGVAVSHGIQAEVKPGPKSVRLEGDADALARVRLEVKDGVLRTKVEQQSWFRSPSLKSVRLYVTNPQVETVEASGGSKVRVSGLDTQKLEVRASGGSELTLKGRATELEVHGSGGSVIEARDVQAESLDVSGSGGTRVLARPSRSLEGSLSGGSTVTVSSKPERTEVSSSGGSQVVVE